ncbi:MAG: inorganic phosphate transporter [Bradymonadales bacterium]|nr:inorganic phosphate transporter [Bradymonadales bacterium]
MLTMVIIIVLVAFAFDFVNGMNDAANSIATIVSTRVLSPKVAVVWAAFFNFAAILIFGTAVAKTIGAGIVDVTVVNQNMVLAALLGAILWSYTCTHFGLPISVSHALIGGLCGAALAKERTLSVLIAPGLIKISAFIVLAPILGMILGMILLVATSWMVHKQPPAKVDSLFRRLQLLSAAAYSLGHGSNDAQKTMGIIAMSLFSAGYISEPAPTWWVIIGAYSMISLGTLTGGWKVIRTLGMKVTHLRPFGGFCAETAAASTLIFTALCGIPVSTTHTITGAIIGVGSAQRLSAVRWGVAGRIAWAWLLTIPGSCIIAAAAWFVVNLLPLPAV